MTVTACSSVAGEVALLGACADQLNIVAAGDGITGLPWQAALHVLSELRLAVETLQQIDAALVRHLYLVGEHGDTEIPGLGVVTIQRSRTRTQWDHDDWKHDVRGAVVDKYAGTELFTIEGEAVDLMDLISKVQNVHGAQAPKVTALRALGLEPKAYCTDIPGQPTVSIKRNGS